MPSAQSHFERGVALEKAGNLDGARAEYEKALVLDSSRADALGNLGMVYLRTGNSALAIASFERVLAKKPDLLQVRFFLGLARYQSNQFDKARTELQRVLAAQPRDGRALHLDGLCLLKMERLEEGARSLEKAVEADPANRAALLTLASTYTSLRRVDKSESLLSGPLAGQESPEVKLVRGMVLNAQGRYRDAETVLAAAAATNPKLATVHHQLGYTRMLLGDYPAAVREFEAELKLNPGDYQAGANLAWILVQERDFERAAPLLKEALAQRPSSPGLLYLMGQVRLSQGNLPKAAESLELAVARQADFRAAHVLLARVYARQNRKDDLARQTALIAKLNAEEQERNVESRESYGDRTAQVPDFQASSQDGSRRQ